jgi:hypothetical protein
MLRISHIIPSIHPDWSILYYFLDKYGTTQATKEKGCRRRRIHVGFCSGSVNWEFDHKERENIPYRQK